MFDIESGDCPLVDGAPKNVGRREIIFFLIGTTSRSAIANVARVIDHDGA